MKATITIYSMFIFFVSITLFSCQQKDANEIPPLTVKGQAVSTSQEQANLQDLYNKAIEKLKNKPEDLQQYVNLASVFVAEARITGNNTYCDNAAMKMLQKVLDSKTTNQDWVFQSLCIKSAIQLNMHQFKDALQTATEGEKLNTFNSGIYGALVDANVEMGNYDEAVKDCDKMLTIRPDLRSYSRASYLRQIFGENAGAIAAMKMAVDAGMPGAENTEWARTTLGDLYCNIGNLDSAYILYKTSLVYRPDYPFAITGMARVEKARGNYDAAIELTRKAIKIQSEIAFIAQLGDLYELKGDAKKAQETREDVVELLNKSINDEPKDALVRHNANREFAQAYLNVGNLEKAEQYANQDLAMRPNNIDANEMMAWISYKKKDAAHTLAYADKMLATHVKNANTLYKAGLIYAEAGKTAQAEEYMTQALAVSKYVDPRLTQINNKAIAAKQ